MLQDEMLYGQGQRLDIPAHARAAHKGLLQKRLEEDLCYIVPPLPPPHHPRRPNRLATELNRAELNIDWGAHSV